MTASPLLRELCYIDGAWLGADNGDTIAVTNPATGEQRGTTVPNCGAAETGRATASGVGSASPRIRIRPIMAHASATGRWLIGG